MTLKHNRGLDGSSSQTAQPGTLERRAEPRTPAAGEVRLRAHRMLGSAFSGQLMDTAPHGFRARHSRLTLAAGEWVEFEFEGRHGSARAAWTRIVDGEAETGFHIVSDSRE